jgi:molybdate transport system substrate-binding protein
MRFIPRITLLLVPFIATCLRADTLTIAVASNFAQPAQVLAALYEKSSGHDVRVTSASTGKLYAQISNGAPFDLLLAADSERPRLLEDSGIGVAGSRFTYALGELVLWSADADFEGLDCREQLGSLGNRKLAIANPLTAPYGVAAREALQAAGVWESVQRNLVFGENISQALHFVASRNAVLGLIAASQSQDVRLPEASCSWPVPASMHSPIEQQAILLSRAADNEVANDFMRYLRSSLATDIIVAHGYKVPR